MRFLFFPLVPKGGESNEVSGDENLTDWRVFCVSFRGPTPETFDLAAGFITSVGSRRTFEAINVIYPIAFLLVQTLYTCQFKANVMPCNINRKCFSVYRSSLSNLRPEGVHCEVVQSH